MTGRGRSSELIGKVEARKEEIGLARAWWVGEGVGRGTGF